MLANISIRTKSLAAFALIAVISLTTGVFGVIKINHFAEGVDEGRRLQTEIEHIDAFEAAVSEQARSLNAFVLTGDRSTLDATLAMSDRIEALGRTLRQEFQDSADSARIESLIGEWRTWREAHLGRVVELMRAPDTIDLARLTQTSGPDSGRIDAFLALTGALKGLKEDERRAFEADQTADANVALLAVEIGAVAVLAVTLLLGFVNGRLMRKLARTMSDMERGDVGAMEQEAARGDELGSMARAAGAFRQKVEEIERAEIKRAESATKAAAERAEMMERLRTAFGDVIEAATAGDFSRRVSADFDDATLRDLAGMINAFVAAVDTGVAEAKRVAIALSEGDLTTMMNGSFAGAFAELQTGLNSSVTRLEDLIGDIAGEATEIRAVSGSILDSAENVADRAEAQASTLEETAATMEEMTATIRSNAENTTSARTLSDEAAAKAKRGGDVVRETETAMANIEASASKISDIVGVIDSIAFQTNLLALNAAVEAARAGDAGKGFAVVASEVRTLAQRSAEAAKDITALIADSDKNVVTGVALVKRTGVALGEIVGSIESVAKSVAEISDANQEQSAGVNEISDAISNMDQITQQNARLAEENANTARALSTRAGALSERVGIFKTRRALDTASTAPRSPAPAPQRAPKPAPQPAPAPREAMAANDSWAQF